MAIIYGISQSERSVIDSTPHSVQNISDVEKVHQKLTSELDSNKKEFLASLPGKIKDKEKMLDEIQKSKENIDKNYDEKIKQLDAKKTKGPFQSVISSVKIAALKHYSKPKDMRHMQKLEYDQKNQLKELQKDPQELVKKEFKEQRNEIQKFDSIKKSPEYKGAKGEVNVLGTLSQLSDDFHVFCDVHVLLPDYVTYRKKKNVGSAQMDFVVVSSRGVALIEVKNWSTRYYQQHQGLSPHEQTDRAGLVLWIALKTWRHSPKVHSILLSVQNNMNYDPKYKHVFVSNVNKINSEIQKQNGIVLENISQILERI